MTRIIIITRQGQRIETETQSMEDAKRLLTQPFVMVEGEGKFTAIAVSSIDLFDATDSEPESGD